jgi:hypothetical protein
MSSDWLQRTSPAFQLMIATSWLAPEPWQPLQERAIRRAIAAQPDWHEYTLLIDRHRTPALSCTALNRVPGISVPAHTLDALQLRSQACRVQALKLCMQLAAALKLLNGAGIPAIPLKGQILSQQLYGDVGLRHAKDIDLEIPREEIARARQCLIAGGWELQSTFFPMTPRQWQSFLNHEHSLDFTHKPSGQTLELHWNSQWETPEEARVRWARSTPAAWQGCSIQTMHPADQTLYLCCHGGRHLWFRAKWIGDIARAHALDLLDWESTWQLALNSGHANVVTSTLALLQNLYQLPIPGFIQLGQTSPASQLVALPLQALENPHEPIQQVGPAKSLQRIRLDHYRRLLWPRKNRWSSFTDLFYARQDFKAVPLPDSLFWLYKPLRPILWLPRWIRRIATRNANLPGKAS